MVVLSRIHRLLLLKVSISECVPIARRPNVFSLLYHTFWCKFKRQHISLKFIYNVTLIWLPTAGFVRWWMLWCFESRARAAVARAAIFIVCNVFKMRERRHGQTKNEIMNGNQGDHVTFVWSWRRSRQRLSFCRTFHPFIQHHDADAVHRRTLRSPDVTVITQAGWYGLSGFEFPVVGQLCVQNVTHACLFAKCATPVQYI